MENSKMFLLRRMVGNEKYGYNSLGELHAKHVDDIAMVMNEFLRETIKELLPLLNSGKSIQIFDDFSVQLKPVKRKKSTSTTK
ncbi:MAG TPA: hypothetical protein VHD35_03900 [Chitinophagaceae bacterium]|nr:hypothetical protein [Chitinophagaceae bacterium]